MPLLLEKLADRLLCAINEATVTGGTSLKDVITAYKSEMKLVELRKLLCRWEKALRARSKDTLKNSTILRAGKIMRPLCLLPKRLNEHLYTSLNALIKLCYVITTTV
jgi:hypothetical protein